MKRKIRVGPMTAFDITEIVSIYSDSNERGVPTLCILFTSGETLVLTEDDLFRPLQQTFENILADIDRNT